MSAAQRGRLNRLQKSSHVVIFLLFPEAAWDHYDLTNEQRVDVAVTGVHRNHGNTNQENMGGFMSRSLAGLKACAPPVAEAANIAHIGDVLPNGEVLSATIILEHQHGLLIRPASKLASTAKKYLSNVRVVFGEREADARSVVGIIGLGARNGDPVRIRAKGADANTAVAELADLIAGGAVPTTSRPTLP